MLYFHLGYYSWVRFYVPPVFVSLYFFFLKSLTISGPQNSYKLFSKKLLVIDPQKHRIITNFN